jgi:hypothetical protein
MILEAILIYLAVSLGSLYLLWIFYLAVMNIKRVRDAGKLHGTAFALGMPILIIGLILDTFVNWVFMTLVFLEIPKETLVTSRLQRWWRTAPTSWRGKLARKFSNIMLDEFDDGDHLN